MKQNLQGVPETLLIPLWMRAAETNRIRPIMEDRKAVEIVSRIEYDFSVFEKSWLSQTGVSIRTKILDDAVVHFLMHNRNPVVINLGAGLDTRHERLSPVDGDWFDLDLPEVIDLRRHFFSEAGHYHMISKSLFDFTWMDEVESAGRPVLIVAEGVFMYFEEAELKPLFRALGDHFPGGTLLFEMLAPMLVGNSKHHDTVKKTASRPEFKWGLKDSSVVASWHPDLEYIEEWNYFDFHKDRWRWFGYVSKVPFMRKRISNRIVHMRFSGQPSMVSLNCTTCPEMCLVPKTLEEREEA